MPDFHSQTLDGRRDHAKGRKIHGVAITGNDLCRNRFGLQAHGCRHMLFNLRVDIGEGAYGTGNRDGRDFGSCVDKACPTSVEFGIGLCELDAESCRFGMYAMGAADGDRVLVFHGACLQRREKSIHALEKKVSRAHKLHVETGVQHIRRRHALMHETGIGADKLCEVRQESDDIMLGFAFDLVNAVDVEGRAAAFLPDVACRALGDNAKSRQSVTGLRLDFEPEAEFCFWRPDGDHVGSRIARYHWQVSLGASQWGGPNSGQRISQCAKRLAHRAVATRAIGTNGK